jgi:hypothetical protein
MSNVADHEIELKLTDAMTVVADSPGELLVGQTVRYSSPDGTVRVLFPLLSPYTVNEVKNAEIHQLRSPGQFGFRCFLTPHGSTTEIGWSPENPKSGGDHDVKQANGTPAT